MRYETKIFGFLNPTPRAIKSRKRHSKQILYQRVTKCRYNKSAVGNPPLRGTNPTFFMLEKIGKGVIQLFSNNPQNLRREKEKIQLGEGNVSESP